MTTGATDIRPLIGLAATRPLTGDEAEAAFGALFEGAATPAQIGGLLMTLRVRGETVEEMAAATRAMRARMHRISAPAGAIDIVGTGGDGKGTLNISTATAFVVAGAGVPVAKHGNRNLSSKSGSADALTHLGLNVMGTPDLAERALAQTGICFMMAPVHHPAMRHVGPARAELGTRTIFNLLGPMTNPGGVRRQLTGTFDRAWNRPMAETLRELGSEAAWLIHGGDGTDELSIAAPSWVAELKDGQIREFEIAPEDAGLPRHPFETILGGNPARNAAALRALLDGASGPYRDAVLLNAAAALLIAGTATDLRQGVEIARESIDSGKARAKLAALTALVGAPEPHPLMIPPAWADLPFFTEDWPAIAARLRDQDWLPGPQRVFAALHLTAPQHVRVVMLGQDPYPTPGHANGLAFSVTPGTALPRSLRNIYAELREDLGAAPANGDLSQWARQGVLLLNTSLSVLPGQAGAHAGLGWDRLARQAVARAQSVRPLAFVLWGAHAQKALADLIRPQDLLIASAHPSPLSARRGFFGSRPFSRVNAWLREQGESPIDWTLSEAAPAQ